MSGSKGIEAARAFVRVLWEDSAIRRGIERTQAMLRSTAAGIGKVGAGLAAAGGAILAPITAAVFQFSEAGSALADMSARTGASAESLSQLKYAAEQSGTSLEAVEKGMKKLNQITTAAADGSAAAADGLDAMGLSAAALEGVNPDEDIKGIAKALDAVGLSAAALKGLPVDQQMKTVAEALSQIQDPGERAARAMAIFGKSGADMLPLLNGGAKGIEDLMNQADQLGLTITGEQAQAAEAFGDAWDTVKAQLTAVSMQIAAAVVPVLTDLITQVTPIIAQVIAWVRENAGIIRGVALLGVALTVAGAALGVFAGLLSGIAFVIGGLLSPLGIVVALVAALGIGIVQYLGGATNAINMLKDAFPGLFGPMQEVFGGLMKLLQAGQYEKAADLLWLGLKLAWVTGVNALSQEWMIWKKAFLDVFDSAATYISKKWAKLQNTLSRGIVSAMSYFDASINVEDVNAQLDDMLARQLATADGGAAQRQKERDEEFATNITGVQAELDAARAALTSAVTEANAIQVPDAVTEKSAALVTQIDDVAVNVNAATKKASAPVQDVRTVSGAGQLTNLINRTGEVSKRQLMALQQIVKNTSESAPQVVNI